MMLLVRSEDDERAPVGPESISDPFRGLSVEVNVQYGGVRHAIFNDRESRRYVRSRANDRASPPFEKVADVERD